MKIVANEEEIMLSIYTSKDLQEAHLIKGKLNNEGIPCFLTNQNFTTLMPHYSGIFDSGIQIMVRECDYRKARNLIMDRIEPDNKGIKCPYCGSEDIGLGFGKNPFFKFLNMIVFLIALIPVGHIKPKFFCKLCYKEVK